MRCAVLVGRNVNVKIGLVLGAGGPVGHAFHAGVLRALSEVTGFQPNDAHLVLGTSAGAQVGALVRAGMVASDLMARVCGEVLSSAGATIARCFRRPDYNLPTARASRRWPAAPRYLSSHAHRPWDLRLGTALAACLPEGRVCLGDQARGLRDLFGEEWPRRPLWIPAVHLDTGRAVAFGRAEAPRTDVGTAVAASGAVPSVCAAVLIGGHRYVDGGMVCLTHVDMLRDMELDLIVVSSPLSRVAPIRWALRRKLRRVSEQGTRVVLFEPTEVTARVMGYRMMDLARAPLVAHSAYAEARLGLLTRGAQARL